MPDRKPPRLREDERTTVLALLQYVRDSLVRKVAGVDDASARSSPVASGTSLVWLLKHMARAESLWVLRRFAALDVALPEETVEPHDTVGSATAAYRRTWAQVDAVVLAEPSLDATTRDTGHDTPVNLRWVLMHLLEETARHAGHADIVREMIDGDTGR